MGTACRLVHARVIFPFKLHLAFLFKLHLPIACCKKMAASMSIIRAWESFFEEISSFLRSAERQSRTASEVFSYSVLERISVYCSSILSLLQHMHATIEETVMSRAESSVISEYIALLEGLLQLLQTTADEWNLHLDGVHQVSSSTMYFLPSIETQRRGRPKFDISRDQLEYLSSMSFSWTQIACMSSVSRMTIYRRRIEYGISSSRNHLSDDDLKIIIQQISAEQPALGETMMWGRIKSMGFHVTRSRLRFAIREVDPLQRALRWSSYTIFFLDGVDL